MEKDIPSPLKDIPPIISFDDGDKRIDDKLRNDGKNEAEEFGKGVLSRLEAVVKRRLFDLKSELPDPEDIQKEMDKAKETVCHDGGLDYITKMANIHDLAISNKAAEMAGAIVCDVKHDEITAPPVPGSITPSNGRE